jgi:uncharacterized protein
LNLEQKGMIMRIARKIRDNIHGTIDIYELEDRILAHPYIQRMRRIKQLAFLQYVFPGASHSRFEHSLGVMHLAGVAWRRLEENQRQLAGNLARFDGFAEVESRGISGDAQPGHGLLSPTFAMIDGIFGNFAILQSLRLAALMHDLGHSPYSHSGEGFMPSWQDVFEYRHHYPAYLSTYIAESYQQLIDKGKDPCKLGIRHEIYTLLLVDQVFTDITAQAGGAALTLGICAQDIASIIFEDIPPPANSPLNQFGIKYLCHDLISGEFDVDRMDYLLRDSKECGVVYGIFDESRILNSLGIYWNPKMKAVHLAIHFSGLAAFEDYLRARHSMYLQLYFHKTSVAAEAMIRRLTKVLNGWHLPLDPKKYAEIDETNFANILQDVAIQTIPQGQELQSTLKLIRDLFYDRNLWKRVFEIASNAGRSFGAESIDEAATIIASLHIPFEKVSSSSSLTRLRPRDTDQESANAMRLIKKDDFQFPRIVPIEDQLSLVDTNAQVHISRLYVEAKNDPKTGKFIPDLVKEEFKKLISSRP